MQALENKRLFMLDYHDLLLPYVNKVRELDDSTLYASRTLFFLNDDSTLRPVAIELTRPQDPQTQPQPQPQTQLVVRFEDAGH
ncbi:hypothetical protein YC2023_079277 [Brassica napus]|uniref:(rape) hypothetical protein n=1 Tax=Brassica napus TaxID=3708 RepID=A0A816QID8_BRANA|nr:unnamed protein product [Brassica napus]